MTGSPLSERDPYEAFITKDFLKDHWANGNGTDIYIDRSYFMNSGPGAYVDFTMSKVMRDLPRMSAGEVINLDSIPRTTGLDAHEFTFNYYESFGINSVEGHALGKQTFLTLGQIRALGDGEYDVSIQIRPYDSPIDFNVNEGDNIWLRLFKPVGETVYGPGTSFWMNFTGPMGGRYISGTYTLDELKALASPPRCFPAQTPIAISPTQTKPITDIRAGDVVMSYAPTALGRGALVPRRVVRLYRGTTDEWVKLTWNEGGEAKELIATPGHHFEAGCTGWGDSDATPRPRATLREPANIDWPIFKHCAQLGAK